MYFLVKIAITLLFVCSALDAGLVVDDGNSQIWYRAPFIYFGRHEFNITAPIVMLDDYDSCEQISTDLTGKIAISPAYADCKTSENELGLGIRSKNMLDANAEAVVFIMQNDIGVDRSFASANVGFLSLDIAILIISFENGSSINMTIRDSNGTLVTGRVFSDDIPVLDIGRTPWHISLMTIGLACDLLALAWTIIQLKNHFYSSQSAAISRIALVLLIIGCVALSSERILTFVYIFGTTFYLDLLTGFMALGVILVTFASTFIALYWNTLLFPHKKRQLESRKIFIPLLCFFSSLTIIYVIMLGLGLLLSITVLQFICACLLGLLALYFVISGIILFKSMKTYFTAIINRKKVVERLRVGLVLAGISLMCLLVAVALASPAPYLADQTYYWLIRVFINLFSATSAAALAYLFRTRQDDASKKSSKGYSSSNNTTKSVGPVV